MRLPEGNSVKLPAHTDNMRRKNGYKDSLPAQKNSHKIWYNSQGRFMLLLKQILSMICGFLLKLLKLWGTRSLQSSRFSQHLTQYDTQICTGTLWMPQTQKEGKLLKYPSYLLIISFLLIIYLIMSGMWPETLWIALWRKPLCFTCQNSFRGNANQTSSFIARIPLEL